MAMIHKHYASAKTISTDLNVTKILSNIYFIELLGI